ncbi:ARID DNA-binding domain-containing protein [Tanacetum coccineum]
MNDDNPIGVASAIQDGVTPSVVDMTVEMVTQNSLEDTTLLEYFPTLTKAGTNTPYLLDGYGVLGKSSLFFFIDQSITYGVSLMWIRRILEVRQWSFDSSNSSTELFSFQFSSIDGFDAMLENGPWFIRNNPLILKKWHPDENLLKEDVSTVPVWVKLYDVPVTAFSEDVLSAIATKLGTPLTLDSYTSDMYMQSWGRSSFARVMIELRADVEFKDNIVVVMPKITRDDHYTCAGEKKTMKKPSQTSLGVSVGPKMDFKPQYEYRLVTKKPNASSSGNMKKGVEPTIEVSNSNPFDVLNSVDHDVEFVTNGGTTNLANNKATSSGSSFMNIDNNGEFASNNPIGEKIDKIELQFVRVLRAVDNDGNLLGLGYYGK